MQDPIFYIPFFSFLLFGCKSMWCVHCVRLLSSRWWSYRSTLLGWTYRILGDGNFLRAMFICVCAVFGLANLFLFGFFCSSTPAGCTRLCIQAVSACASMYCIHLFCFRIIFHVNWWFESLPMSSTIDWYQHPRDCQAHECIVVQTYWDTWGLPLPIMNWCFHASYAIRRRR